MYIYYNRKTVLTAACGVELKMFSWDHYEKQQRVAR